MPTDHKWNYFTEAEVKDLDLELVAKLDQARHLAGIPFVITDGRRYGTGKADRNAVNNSAHLSGLAVDLRCRDSRALAKMLTALSQVGFRRIGIYVKSEAGKKKPTHVHADVDATKDQDVAWVTEEL